MKKRICPNCGEKLSDDVKTCMCCGEIIYDDIEDVDLEEQESFKNQELDENEIDELVDAYIGEKADSIRNQRVSIFALLFGLFYYLYRKMYLLVATLVVLNVLILAIPHLVYFALKILSVSAIKSSFIYDLMLMISKPLVIVVRIVVAIRFNQIYLDKVSEKVEQIKLNNPYKSIEELKEICSKKGGTNIIAAMISCIVFLLVFVIIIKKVL